MIGLTNKVSSTSSPKPLQRRTELLKMFATSTTLHGVSGFFNSKCRCFKAIWLILVVAALGLFIYLIQRSVSQYFDYPYTTVIKMKHVSGGLVFPSVTICAPSLYQKDKMFAPDDVLFTRKLNLKACSETVDLRTTLNLTCGEYLKYLLDNVNELNSSVINKLDSVFDIEEFQTKYSYDVFKHGSGYIHCRWKGKPCVQTFTATLTEYGYCYTFNSGNNGNKLLTAEKPGRVNSLFFEVDVNRNDLYDSLHKGTVVILHENGSHFNPFQDGFFAQPGISTQIAVEVEKEKRLKAPYETKCQTKTLEEASTYTRRGCQMECRTQYITKQCGCKPPFYKGSPSAPVCSLRQWPCLDNAKETFREEICESLCPLACEATNYHSSLSFYLSANPNGDIKRNERNNLVSMRITFNELKYTMIEQTPSFDIVKLLGEVGGYLGLLLGCSALTVFEFIELIAMMFCSRETTLLEMKHEKQEKENEIKIEDISHDHGMIY